MENSCPFINGSLTPDRLISLDWLGDESFDWPILLLLESEKAKIHVAMPLVLHPMVGVSAGPNGVAVGLLLDHEFVGWVGPTDLK